MSLKKQQSQVTQMTTQVNYCKGIPEDSTLSTLKIRLAKVQTLYKEFEENQNALDELIGEEHASQNFSVRTQVDEYYFFCAGELQSRIDQIIKHQERQERKRQMELNGRNANQQQEVKLPKIEITPFSGEYEDWPSFRDLFLSLIDSNKIIGNVQKLHYLKGLVKGEAEALIKSISVTEANYVEAWTKLSKRFDHKRYIVDSLLKKLFNQPKIAKENHSNLKQLIDKSSEIVQSLELQNVQVDHCNPFIVHIVVSKLDAETHKQWELLQHKDDLPTFKQLQEFLEARWQSLEMINEDNQTSDQCVSDQVRSGSSGKSFTSSSSDWSKQQSTATCHYCREMSHRISNCSKYISLSVTERKKFIKKNRLCYNCMSTGHQTSECTSISRCRTCKSKHHTSIHLDNVNSSFSAEGFKQESNGDNVKNSAVGTSTSNNKRVLLATAVVYIHSNTGEKFPVKALIDKGSETAMVTESLAAKLNLIRTADDFEIKGLGDIPVNTHRDVVSFRISSHIDSTFEMDVEEAVLMNKITGDLPSVPVLRKDWTHLRGIKLADMHFDRPSPIDILLGAEAFESIVLDGIIQKQNDSPTAMNSRLGWLLFGVVKGGQYTARKCHVGNKSEQLDKLLRSFWEMEEMERQETRKLTVKELQAEEIYKNNVHKTIEGRYEVPLLFDPDKESFRIGESKKAAVSNLFKMEQRFKSNNILKERYKNYMQNLIDSGHIELVPKGQLELENHKKFYLPHHSVMKEESLTTKLRVVFDASRKSSTGVSLNDLLLVGPKTQEDLFAILTRWRKHKIAFLADVEKMYRQVKILLEHRDFQRLLWRFNENEPILEYRITTVIDGTASASYLATKTLQKIADDGAKEYPEAAKIVKQDFYVDDMSSGSSTVEKAKQLQNDLINLLKTGKMVLRKWFSNCKELLENVPEENRHDQSTLVEIVEKSVKTLGVYWNQLDDAFQFKIAACSSKDRLTKRELFSDISKLFDPMGWMAPCTITAKILMQSLWQVKDLGWDNKIPKDKMEFWKTYRDQLHLLEQIKIPRWIGSGELVKIQLHVFGDASNAAYAAVVYSRIVYSDGSIVVNLISAKTKVSPIKVLCTPKLELCASVLAARLISKVKESFKFDGGVELFNYSDNTTVLAWLKSQPNQYNVFVANRITEVITLTNPQNWFFVASEDNPADVASRGVMPSELKDHKLWWTGPSWLSKPQNEWPSYEQEFSTNEERRKIPINAFLVNRTDGEEYLTSILKKYSYLEKLLRDSTYIFNFISNKKETKFIRPNAMELKRAFHGWIRHIQSSEFRDEVERCKSGDDLLCRSRLRHLRPLVDADNILRVGGRLSKAELPFEAKHPIILPKGSHLTKLIIEQAHRKTLHGGPTLMSAFLSNYWIFGKASLIRTTFQSCVQCFRYQCKPESQIMGDLPAYRVNQRRAFLHCGVDFAGPITTKTYSGRSRGKHSNPTVKSYIAIFVCMVTKALHIELVSNQTAAAFIECFKRFVARRGKCSDMYSDNGKNFVGGNRELRKQFNVLMNDPQLQSFLAEDGTVWHFNPPESPHFGGLWEVGVKSIKYHLKRLIGNNTFTFEEVTTLLCQIEACLNSRPLCQISDDTEDISYLTPGHFLIGEAPITVPEISLLDENVNRLSRWKLLQHTYQLFWKYWSTEYLQSLQKRPKWMQANENVKVGQIALLREADVPPGKWPLGKIVKVYLGADGKVRVVKIEKHNATVKPPVPRDLKKYVEKMKTHKSTFDREIGKISVLPIEDNE